MKKSISILLVLALMLGMISAVFAVDVPTITMTADKTSVAPGETVTVTLQLDCALEAEVTELHVCYDPALFTYLDMSSERYGDYLDKGHVSGTAKVILYDLTTGEPLSLQAGELAKVTFQAKETPSDEAALRLHVECLTAAGDVPIAHQVSGEQISVPIVSAAQGYTVTMGADATVTAGEWVELPVQIGHTDESVKSYNAYDMTFSFDQSILELDMAATDTEGYRLIPGEGTLRVFRYGAEAALGEALRLRFIGRSAGTAEVRLESACVDISANAITTDAPEAVLLDASAAVTVSGYSVSLSDDFVPAQGEDLVVAPGESFTFLPKDPNYDYDVTVTVGGVRVEPVENADGSYTVTDIHGNVVVTATKTPKRFPVTLGEDTTGASEAVYLTDYSFTLTPVEGYSYSVSVTIAGQPYSAFTAATDAAGATVYTIPGADITGAVVINSNKTALRPTEHTVTFIGNGAGDLAEGTATTVVDGETYSFTLNPAEGFRYTVTATMGGEMVAVTPGENNSYSIAGVKADLVITITREELPRFAVTVRSYVELDGSTVFLVTVSGTPDSGKTYAYDGNVMYKIAAYGENTYAWLVIVEGEALTTQEAEQMISLVEASAEELTQTCDVNETGLVDINDAQLVYDLYNGRYADFTTVSVRKFLKADADASGSLNAQDAVMVLANVG